MPRVQMIRTRSLTDFVAGITAVVFTAVVRSGKLLFSAKIVGSNAASPVDICDDVGKVKVFKDVDDFVSKAAKLALFSTAGVSMSVSNLPALDPAPFTGDIVAKSVKTVADYNAAKLAATTVAATLATAIGLMPSTTAAEIAFKTERQAQKDAVDQQIAWYTSEVTRINNLLAV